MEDSEKGACCSMKKRPESASQQEAAVSDQVVLITGCASGVGLSTALAFAKLNYRLALVDSNASLLAEAVQLCCLESSKGHKPLELALDLATDKDVAKSVIDSVLTHFGRLDVLVNNTSSAAHNFMLTKYDDENCIELYHKIIGSNMHALVYLCLAAFEALSKSHGSIVNVSSVLDDKPAKYKFAHCMSKAAVAMLTRCLANDFAPQVRVNAVSPGPIVESILDDLGGLRSVRSEQQQGGVGSKSASSLRGTGKPDEVAKMIVFLSSKDKATFITGSRLLVDGGYSLVANSQ